MKKNRLLQIGAFVLLAAGTISASLSVAWFHPTTKIGNKGETNAMPIDGSSSSGYFAYGDGSSESPYGIRNPRHLYNLAWLQYLGFFNNNKSPFYFVLDPADESGLDMSGWILPPIGTSKYPFIGNFNGNNKLVKNLVIDNVVGEDHIVQRPSIITSDAYDSNGVLKTYLRDESSQSQIGGSFLNNQVNILGLFGILGDYTDMVPVSATYSDTNSVHDLAIDNITINSSSTNSLVGMACGYDNAALDKIAVDNSTINVAKSSTPISSISTNISDYSLVGYATDEAKSKCYYRADTVSLPKVVNPNTNMGGNNWGGSIAMKDIFGQLKDIRDNELSYSLGENISSQTIVNGEIDHSLDQKEDIHIFNRSTSNYNYVYHQYHTGDFAGSDGKVYASFTMSRSADSENATTNDDGEYSDTHVYACLDGVRTKTMTATTHNITTVNNVAAGSSFYISDGKGNYLRYNSGITNTTNFNNATRWTYDANRRIVSGTNRYLRNYDGDLTTTTGNGTTIQWNISNDGVISSVYSGTTWYLSCINGSWGLINSSSIPEYYISDGNGNYLSVGNDTSPVNQTSQNNATVWIYDESYFYAKDNPDQRIMVDYYGEIVISTDGYRNFNMNGNTLRVRRGYGGNSYYYVYFNGSSWTTSTSSRNLTFTQLPFSPQTLFFVSNQTDNTQSKTYSTKPTFFPLLMTPDTYEPMDGYMESEGEQKQYNTGYVISGNNINSSSAYQNYTGDIRFAGFPYNGRGTSSTTNSLYNYTSQKTVHTRTRYVNGSGTLVDSGWTTISTSDPTFANTNIYNLQKFKKSFASFNNTLTESAAENHVYGVHFMDASIQNDPAHKVIIPKAKVLDKPATLNPVTHQYEDHISTYENYEAPQDAIDFYLKSYGYVNFFAGTYFSSNGLSNDSFFSLNQIIRNEYVEPTDTTEGSSTIKAIKRIAKIYSPVDSQGNDVAADDDNPYVYLYGDGTYSSTGSTDQPARLGKEIFNTDWIEKPSRDGHDLAMYTLYYFEIPVNAGEYALGSVSGTTGCYLNYLDIGAGAPAFKDVEVTEKIISDITNLSFPLGVDFADLDNITNLTPVISAIVGGKSAAVTVVNGTGSSVKYTYTTTTSGNVSSSNLVITKPGSDPPNIDLYYKASSVSVEYGNDEMGFDVDSASYSITFERETKDHYNPSSGSGASTKTIIEKYTIGEQIEGATIQLPNNGQGYSPVWSVLTGDDGGTATVTVSDTGLVTFATAGTAVIQATWKVETQIGESETWNPMPNNNSEGTETEPIITWHFIDMTGSEVTPPNVVVSYVYSGEEINNKATLYYDITIDNTSGEDLIFVIDSIKLTYTSEPDATYIVRVNYGDQTVIVDGQTGQIRIPVPANNTNP